MIFLQNVMQTMNFEVGGQVLSDMHRVIIWLSYCYEYAFFVDLLNKFITIENITL